MQIRRNRLHFCFSDGMKTMKKTCTDFSKYLDRMRLRRGFFASGFYRPGNGSNFWRKAEGPCRIFKRLR